MGDTIQIHMGGNGMDIFITNINSNNSITIPRLGELVLRDDKAFRKVTKVVYMYDKCGLTVLVDTSDVL